MFKNYYHHPIIKHFRTFARSIGVLGLVKRYFSAQHSYEEAFHLALKKSVSSGDCVWDIGANIGYYTDQFLNWAGPSGKIIAFEPLPNAYNALTNNLQSHNFNANLTVEHVALSDKPGEAFFLETNEEENPITTTAHIIDGNDVSENNIRVKVSTADIMTKEVGTPIPNVVKIDVEGFEEDVLRGGVGTFSHPDCKHLLIEMHFTRMDERKLGDSPSRIVKMLKGWGYQIKWIDPSHIHASRQHALNS